MSHPARTVPGPSRHQILLALALVALLLASLWATPNLGAHPDGTRRVAGPSGPADSTAPFAWPLVPQPALSPLSAGNVARSVLVNYNASWPGNFLSSVDDWVVGPGAFVQSTGLLWLSDLPASVVPGPLPRSAPAILFDPATNSFAGIVPALTNTSDLVYDPANGYLYSADPFNNTVGVFNPATDAWVATIHVGSEPVALVLDNQTGSLFAANYGSSNLTVINTATDVVTPPGLTTGTQPFAMAIDPTNQTLFVACGGSTFLTVFNSSTLGPITTPTFSLGGPPAGIAYSPFNYAVAVSVPSKGLVAVFNATNGATTATIKGLGAGIRAVSDLPSNSDFVVANFAGSTIAELDPTTGTVVIASLAVGRAPSSFDSNPSGGAVYVWSSGSRHLSLVWTGSTITTANSPSLGPAPSALAYDPSTGRVLVANSNDSTVSFLSAVNLATVAPPLQLSSTPLSLVFDPSTGMVYAGLASGLVSINPATANVVATSTAFTGATEALLVDSADGLLWAMNSINGVVGYGLPGLSPTYATGIGSGQSGIQTLALDPTTDQLFAPVNTTGTAGIAVLDATTGTVVIANVLTAPDLTSLAYDPADGDVYALGSNLSVLNGSTLTAVGPGITVAPHSASGAVVYDPSREFLYATTMNGPGASGVLTVVDGTSAVASYSSEVNLAVGEGPVSAISVALPNSSAAGTSEIWVGNSASGTIGLVASSPPRISAFSAVPYQVDLGSTVHFVLTYGGGAGVSSIAYTGLPAGCTSSSTVTLNCTPSATGSYVVTAIVTDSLGDSGSSTATLQVNPGLTVTAAFTPTKFPQTDVGSLVAMTAVVGGGVGPYVYQWVFGDGNSSTGHAVDHTYQVVGNFVLTLTATDSLGGVGSAAWAVQVNPPIALRVSAPTLSTDALHALSVSANVTGGTGPLGSVTWSFGDGGTEVGSQASHLWTSPGVYNVTAQVADAIGASATQTVQVHVNSAPAGRFTVSGGTTAAPPRPGTLFYYNSTLFGGTGPFSVLWEFGDGSGAVGANLTHAYAASGTYNVTALESDAAGVTVNATLTVTVLPALPTSSSGGSSASFPEGIFLGVILGAAVGAILVYAAGGKRRKSRPPPPPSPYVPPTHPAWKED